MKFIIALACLVALACANENANVLKREQEVNVNDFKFAYELDNSVKVAQEGKLKGEDIWEVKGDQGWTSPEGEQVSLQYVADENGYQVLSANPALPTPPPIPEAIQRALEWIAAHPKSDE
ncbi:cuticular protein 47Eg [Drosophila virilis]|uniref:Cuticular protein 47Eg n=1 Tax=Drosophila virilis TaxID=7244 RepID=B4MFL9_DROVI|nr:cuticular protein 47Eg [Drosophila virilis]EDW57190.1 uncharacterized protein Dvir_GJ15011 [Drosophila virilis]